MSWLARLFAPLRRLFGGGRTRQRFEPLDLRHAAPAAPPPPEPMPPTEPPPAAPSPPAVPPVPDFPPLPESAATVEVEEGEDAFEEEERAADPLTDAEADLDARPDLDVIVAARQARLGDAREEAERQALEGEQRVRLTDPAGPGTLAETLARLEREGRVSSTLADDDGEPVLVYTPVDPAAGPSPVTTH